MLIDAHTLTSPQVSALYTSFPRTLLCNDESCFLESSSNKAQPIIDIHITHATNEDVHIHLAMLSMIKLF